ncbi:putative G-protein coupled receptor 32 [Saguinus oedipus]|uniref:G-protein coupled receptor 32 n=1 Tax=Saguinus oedipus TaxID=9490 RepID=A0ABQ9TW34_SAGOE|nr:putative G-protein coupled receptor 32 [Saguinus oedipus]
MAVLSVSFVVGVVGNGLVLWMTVFRMARTVSTVWFFHLALADFMLSLSLPITSYYMASGQWLLGEWACKLYATFVSLTFFGSNYLLVLISVDRCISVLYPVWALNHRTAQRASWLAIAVWLLAGVLSSSHLKFRTIKNWNGCEQCYLDFNSENVTSQAWSEAVLERRMASILAHFLLGFLGPLAVIGICAHLIRAKLFREGWVHAHRPKRLLLVLVSAFFICWSPFNVVLMVHLWLRVNLKELYRSQMLLIYQATFALGSINSCLNPFLYVFVGRDFQEKFFQSLPSALARAFGEEELLRPPIPVGRGASLGPVPVALPPGNDGSLEPPGNDGSLEPEAGNCP